MTNLTTPPPVDWTGWERGRLFEFYNNRTGERGPAGPVKRRDEVGDYVMKYASPDGYRFFHRSGDHCYGWTDYRVVNVLNDPFLAETGPASL